MNSVLPNDPSPKRHYKLIMLVIASYDGYDEFINNYKKYIKKFDDVKIYLLFCRNDLEEELVVDDDDSIIFYNCEESLIPGIYLKSMHAMNYCHKNFTYDFLVRTNISSFYNIPHLLQFLDEQPKTNFVGGYVGKFYKIYFVSGTGIIMSKDIVDKILTSALPGCINVTDDSSIGMNDNENNVHDYSKKYPDDVVISYLINLHLDVSNNAVPIPLLFVDEKLTGEKMDLLKNNYFHFRNRNSDRLMDTKNIDFLINYFYGL